MQPPRIIFNGVDVWLILMVPVFVITLGLAATGMKASDAWRSMTIFSMVLAIMFLVMLFATWIDMAIAISDALRP